MGLAHTVNDLNHRAGAGPGAGPGCTPPPRPGYGLGAINGDGAPPGAAGAAGAVGTLGAVVQTGRVTACQQKDGLEAIFAAAAISLAGPVTSADKLPHVMLRMLKLGCARALSRPALVALSLYSSEIWSAHAKREMPSKKNVAKSGRCEAYAAEFTAGIPGLAGFGSQYMQVEM
jgi:hypothetical protein